MNKLILFALILFVTNTIFAANYVVSGAGSPEVNGTYSEDGVYNGKPQYRLGSSFYYLRYNNMPFVRWEIWDDDSRMTYYYTDDAGDTPPSSGWMVYFFGFPPAPSVSIEGPAINYSSNAFWESSNNDGSIETIITITCNNIGGLTFTGSNGDNFVTAGKVVVTNLPTGLTAVITKTDNLTLSVSLTGIASNHNNVNDVANLTFAFQNSAFSNNDASVVLNSTISNLEVDYIQVYNVAASGGDYTIVSNAITASDDNDIINIAAGTYTEAGTEIRKSLTIIGAGTNETIIQAASSKMTASDRVFYTDGNVNITIKNLTIRYGYRNIGGNDEGGGIFVGNSGNAAFENILFIDNVGYYGGAIFYSSSNQTSTITNCTFYGNSATSSGSVIFNSNAAGVNIINSTLTGNTATNYGAIYSGSNSILTLKNCTITNNISTDYDYGGLYTNWGIITISNTILADNDTYDYYVYSRSTLTDNGYNIIEHQGSNDGLSTYFFNQATDILYSHDYLGNAEGAAGLGWNRNDASISGSLNISSTLADNNTTNGTQTLALASGSFAIDAGTDSGVPTTDQRGAGRNSTTDIGAYEWWSDDGALPVELIAFTASANDNVVLLNWQTTTEVNNYGFEIQKLEVRSQKLEEDGWEKVGFVEGAGNSNSPKEYSFIDQEYDQDQGIIKYRLKQIDFDGQFEYSDVVEIEVNVLPTEFSLSQNYPNPFNPSTSIEYTVVSSEYVNLKIYDVLGNEIATLVNEMKDAGKYRVNFNASSLSSGVYFYMIQAGSFNQVRKMMLLR